MSSSAEAVNTAALSSEGKTEKNWSMISLIVGLVGLGVAILGLVLGYGEEGTSRAWTGYLIGFAFWISILVGALMFIMISYAFDAGWSIIIRRQLEHLLSALPWMALIFTPLILAPWVMGNPGILWKWMNPEYVLSSGITVGEDPIFLWKEPWLNMPFMTTRTYFYFGVFIAFATILRRLSFGMDKDGDPSRYVKARYTSGVGIILVGLCASFAAFDWFMSLEFHWFSTMYGVWFFAAAMRATFAFTIILCFFLASRGYLKGIYNQAHRYDLGCLSLAFTVFWAYISFSQMFLIYQASIPEETFWYSIRLFGKDGSYNDWWYVSMSLIFLHFFVPFLFLLFYSTKISIPKLVGVSVWILLFHLLDIYYNILPAKGSQKADGTYDVVPFTIQIWDIAALIGIGGIVVWAFINSSKKTKPIPIKDPRILDSIHHHE